MRNGKSKREKLFVVKHDDDNEIAGTDGIGTQVLYSDNKEFTRKMNKKGFKLVRSDRFDGGFCETWERKPKNEASALSHILN